MLGMNADEACIAIVHTSVSTPPDGKGRKAAASFDNHLARSCVPIAHAMSHDIMLSALALIEPLKRHKTN